MKCSCCKKDFEEKDIHESHDVPCYLFFIEAKTRRERKQFADKFTRKWLCKECHDKYERLLRDELIQTALDFSIKFEDMIDDKGI